MNWIKFNRYSQTNLGIYRLVVFDTGNCYVYRLDELMLNSNGSVETRFKRGKQLLEKVLQREIEDISAYMEMIK